MIRCLSYSTYRCFTKTCKKHWWNDMSKTSSDMDKYSIFLEFWDDRKFIGSLYGDTFYSSDEIYIDHIFVNEKYRNKGYGRCMINHLKNSYKYIYIESTMEAFDFYKKCGFIKRRDQNHRIYSDTIDMYLKVKKYEKKFIIQ